VTPSALHASDRESFFVFAWPEVDAATALAAMLERDTRWPVQEKEEWVIHTRNLSYFSRKTSPDNYPPPYQMP
jgi:hypothetical protein